MPTPACLPRKIRDHEDAAACLAAVESSGLTLRAWCHAEGVNARSLHVWKLALSRSVARGPGKLRLVELVTAPLTALPLRVHIGDVSIDVPMTFDELALRRLVGVLRQC